jgi:hypothetical protein
MPARSVYRLSGFAAILAGILFALVGVSFFLALVMGDVAGVANAALLPSGRFVRFWPFLACLPANFTL